MRGYRKKSLDLSGALTALIVGFISICGGLSWTLILLFFFVTCSALTKYKSDIKRKREDGYKEGGQRNFEQVIANGFFPTFICLLYQIVRVFQFENFEALYLQSQKTNAPMELSRIEIHRYLYGNFYYFNAKDYPLKTFLLVCYLCCYIANTSDTWSSEYGILSKKEPIFILNFKKTFHGVNGGVSLSGYLASLVCGISYSMLCLFMICLDFFYARYFGFNDIGTMLVGGHETSQLPLLTQLLTVLSYQYPIVILCIFSALFGTTLDSVLGAIFEYSGYDEEKKMVVKKPGGEKVKHISGFGILSGNQVNFLSGCITGLVCATMSLWLFNY
ncbi:hypothetical protein FDP41_009411 [Naegleria fowleri]|uniref:DUF92 domain-containing protein n=1 Tax=Naegleria fowleri TaxID=5763 RepID=A0A6A5BF07_NAEFO|nr:uncharacterized protein FDP41_009411 [Naegleria fowleri]KAF0972508.1 hypothetical protein FDP41_009411 [Naegleria fowleri]